MPRFLLSLVLLLTSTVLFAGSVPSKQDSKASHLIIQSGSLVSSSGGPIEVRSFDAAIQDGHRPGSSSQKEEKVVTIERGQAFLSNDSLGKLLTAKLRGRNLEDIKVTFDKGKVKITGKAKKALTLPFTIEGPVSLTPDGHIRLKAEKMEVGKLPGLADLLGINPEKMAGDGKVKGVEADKDSITFDPDLLWGLPVHGVVRHLAYGERGLTLDFGSGAGGKRKVKESAKAGK